MKKRIIKITLLSILSALILGALIFFSYLYFTGLSGFRIYKDGENTIKVACVGMMAMAMTSCLDFSPEAQMNDDTVWKSASNFQLFANQFYSYTRDIQSGDPYQYAVSDGPHSDTRSDLMAEANVNVYSQGTNTVPEKDNNYT